MLSWQNLSWHYWALTPAAAWGGNNLQIHPEKQNKTKVLLQQKVPTDAPLPLQTSWHVAVKIKQPVGINMEQTQQGAEEVLLSQRPQDVSETISSLRQKNLLRCQQTETQAIKSISWLEEEEGKEERRRSREKWWRWRRRNRRSRWRRKRRWWRWRWRGTRGGQGGGGEEEDKVEKEQEEEVCRSRGDKTEAASEIKLWESNKWEVEVNLLEETVWSPGREARGEAGSAGGEQKVWRSRVAPLLSGKSSFLLQQQRDPDKASEDFCLYTWFTYLRPQSEH